MSLFTDKTRSFVTFAALAGLTLALGGCMGAKPFAYHPISEIPEGPGLVSGKEGGYVITLGGHDKPQARPAPQARRQAPANAHAEYRPQQPAYQQPPKRHGRMSEAVTQQ